MWLDHGSELKKPPEQLPIVLQVQPKFLYSFLCILCVCEGEKTIFIYHFRMGLCGFDLRNFIWLPSGGSIIELFAYFYHIVFIDSGFLQVLLSQCHRFRALVLLGRFLDMGSWAVDLVYF